MRHTATGVFALFGLMATSAVANELKFDTKDLQEKMMTDMVDMIQNYDFTSILEEAVDSTTDHVNDIHASKKSTIEELLSELSVALAEQKADMWPNAPLKDSQMLEHINVEFDLHNGKVIAETLAKDEHGNAKYEYIYDTNSQNAVQIDQTETKKNDGASASSFFPWNKKADKAVPAETAPVVPAEVIPAEVAPVEDAETIIIVPDAEVEAVPVQSVDPYAESVLSIEEQREIALKVTFFFFLLIGGTFIALYVYHKMEQRNKPADKKQSFFEFMSGQMDSQKYPVYANCNTRFAI